MVLGPISDVERITWQRQAVAVLDTVLAEAAEAKLPCVHWEIGSAQTLHIRCLQPDDAERRTAFQVWARFLGIEDRREWECAGFTHLQGNRPGYRGCTIVLTADLRLDNESDRPGQRR